jgi:hypothetical protein
LEKDMLRQTRNRPAVRLALAVALLLALGASFGLHPEPASQGSPSGVSGISTARSAAAPHGCLACLTHGATMVSPLFGIVLEAAPSSATGLPEGSLPPARLTCRDLSGRSPPARS